MIPESPPETQARIAHAAAFGWAMGDDAAGMTRLAELIADLRDEVRQALPDTRILPAPDGICLLMDGSLSEAAAAALDLAQSLPTPARVGFSSGPVYGFSDISLQETVTGPGINAAFRLREMAEEGQVLFGGAALQELAKSSVWSGRLASLGSREIRSGKFIPVYAVGGRAAEVRPEPTEGPLPKAGIARKIVIVYKRRAMPDYWVLYMLERALKDFGHDVFIDQHLIGSTNWREEIRRRILAADFVIPLVSLESASSEMMLEEVRLATDEFEKNGRPRLLPIRVAYEGGLPSELATYLDPIQYILWEEPSEDRRVVGQVQAALQLEVDAPVREEPKSDVPQIALEALGGGVPLSSRFYVPRPADADLKAGIDHRDSILLVKAARQMGKTSLLARGCQHARDRGSRVVVSDLQRFERSDFESLDSILLALAYSLSDGVEGSLTPDTIWAGARGAMSKFETFLRRFIEADSRPLVWGLDEVDRLQGRVYTGDLFGKLRSFHNARALEPQGPFDRLTMIFSYATEASDFIADLDQSPFNVGTEIPLSDFTIEETGRLHLAYGSPLKDGGLNELFNLVGGHPYLLRRGLTTIVTSDMSLEEFKKVAPLDDGPLGDHLKRLMFILTKDPGLLGAAREAFDRGQCSDRKMFYRLHSAGIVAGDSPLSCGPRCSLYGDYLRQCLPKAF